VHALALARSLARTLVLFFAFSLSLSVSLCLFRARTCALSSKMLEQLSNLHEHTATHCHALHQHTATTHCNNTTEFSKSTSQQQQLKMPSGTFLCVAVYCSVLQCIAVCCSVLQCVAVCLSVLQLKSPQTYFNLLNTQSGL